MPKNLTTLIILCVATWLLGPPLFVYWPERYQLERLEVSLAPGESIHLGKHALAARAAADAHIEIGRDNDKGWHLINVAEDKRLLWRDETPSERLWPIDVWQRFCCHPYDDSREVALSQTAEIHLGTDTLRTAREGDALIITQANGARYRFDGLTLSKGAELSEPRHSMWARSFDRLRHITGQYRLLEIGGAITGDDTRRSRLGLVDIPVGLVSIRRSGNTYRLRLNQSSPWHPVVVAQDGLEITPTRQAISLLPEQHLTFILGYSRFIATLQSDRLVIEPLTRSWRRDTPPKAENPTAVASAWRQVSLTGQLAMSFPHLAVGTAIGMLLYLILQWRINRSRPFYNQLGKKAHSGFCLVSLNLGIASALAAGATWPIMLAFMVLNLMVAQWRLRASFTALLVALLILIGTANLLVLQLFMAESHYSEYLAKFVRLTGIVLAMALWWITICPHIPDWRKRLARVLPGIGHALLALATVLMLIQGMVGTEEGVFGYQPVELAKFALLLFLAIGYGRYLDAMGGSTKRDQLRNTALITGFSFVAVTVVLWRVHDASPILMFAILLTVMAGGWWVTMSRKAVIILLVLTLIPAVMHLWLDGDVLLQHLAALEIGFIPIDRIQAFVHPELTLHSNAQWLAAQKMLAASSIAPNFDSGVTHALAAIQDDFSMTHLINRLGKVVATLYTLTSLLLVGEMLLIGIRTISQSLPRTQHYTIRQLSLTLGALCFGGGTLLAAHLLLCYGTNFGFLPVIGQPLPWISAATSFHLALVFPLSGLAIFLETELIRKNSRQLTL